MRWASVTLQRFERIVSAKYQRGAALNRQHPYVEVLFSDITESGEALDLGGLVRLPLPPALSGWVEPSRPSEALTIHHELNAAAFDVQQCRTISTGQLPRA